MKIKCNKCGDILEGDKRGTLIYCSCRSIAIDETKWYARVLYKTKEDYEEVKEK
jgi:hypothetical protein